MDFTNKNVLVYGTGISGISAVSLLESVQAKVILYDENTKITKEQVRAKLAEDTKARIILGVLSDEIINTLDMVVLSPGVPTDIPIVEQLKNLESLFGVKLSLLTAFPKAVWLPLLVRTVRLQRQHWLEN